MITITTTPERDTVLTGKGRAVALLLTVRERWDGLTPSQRAECLHILERLAEAIRRDQPTLAEADRR